MELFRTVMLAHFSSSDERGNLMLGIYRKLIIGVIGAGLLGYTIAQSVSKAILPYGFSGFLLLTISTLVGFVIGAFVSLTVGIKSGVRNAELSYEGILSTLSISKSSRWIARELPVLIILVVSLLFLLQVAYAVAHTMLSSPIPIMTGLIIGLYSGYGVTLFNVKGKKVVTALLFTLVLLVAGYLLDKFVSTGLQDASYLYAVMVVLLFSSLGHLYLYINGQENRYSSAVHEVWPIIPSVIPYAYWYLVKLWRNKRTRGAFLIAITLALSAAVVLAIKDATIADPYQLLIFPAVLGVTYGCDIRGIIAKFSPPDVVLIKGASGFVRSEIVATLAFGVVIGLPMLLTLLYISSFSASLVLYYLVLQSFSVLIGLLASTLFVPASKDTASQFMATVSAVGALFGLPKLGHFNRLGDFGEMFCWLTASLMAVAVIYLIESYRRKGYGGLK